MTTTSAWPLGQPTVGATAAPSRTVGADDIDLFTRISGDRNPLHHDHRAAESSRFGQITEARGDKPITRLNCGVTRDDGTVALAGTAVCWTMHMPGREGGGDREAR